MKSFNKILIALFIAMFAGSFQMAVAEEAPVAKAAAVSPAQTVFAHVEAALSILIDKGDLSNAQPHIKEALEAARGVTGDSVAVKQGWDNLVKGRIETKRGNLDNAIKALTEAAKIYKSL